MTNSSASYQKASSTKYAKGTTTRKITDEQILEVQRAKDAGETNMKAISDRMGLHYPQVYNIFSGKLKTLAAQAAEKAAGSTGATSSSGAPEPKSPSQYIKALSNALRADSTRHSDAKCDEVRRMHAQEGKTNVAIAAKVGITANEVGRILRGDFQDTRQLRTVARQAGVWVDGVLRRAADGSSVARYEHAWAAERATNVKAKDIIRKVQAGDAEWQKAEEDVALGVQPDSEVFGKLT